MSWAEPLLANRVAKKLLEAHPGPKELARADLTQIEEEVRSSGHYRVKARHLKQMAEMIVREHDSRVPGTMEGLLRLPGVGRKTANVVLSNAYGITQGIAVDTHVHRLSRRLGLTAASDPGKVEIDLMRAFPRCRWSQAADLLIAHGRKVCLASRPRCSACVLRADCTSALRFMKGS